MQFIVKTSDGQLFRVSDAGADYPQAWIGRAVKAVRGEFIAKAKSRDILVRKAGSRLVALESDKYGALQFPLEG